MKTLKAHCGGIDRYESLYLESHCLSLFSMIIQEKHQLILCGTATGAVCVWNYSGDTSFIAKLEGHTGNNAH